MTPPPAAAIEAGVGIVHLGLGAFHRAHQAIITQRALTVVPGPWAISGASLRSADVSHALRPQDCLYTLLENDGLQERASVVGIIHEALWAPSEGEALLARIAAPATRIVTLTVTEKGYCHNPATGDLDLAHPDIASDLTVGDLPRSTLGWLVRGLKARRDARTGGLTVLCCDNMGSPCCAATTWAHRAVLRQHGEQRPHPTRSCPPVRRTFGPRSRCLDRGRASLPEQHGRPDRPGGDSGLAGARREPSGLA